ncbi:M20/M25/M40 family metallo-hydrolase [Erythrobacter sp.]|jgi:hypothetical protein|uniref:M20/M25/M40 family metallo-hydrolase n=1 Tax=Erythrobacter sp. TaxID=1042 RepID=UPI002EC6070C|nr:M20/M25/M40 family metallo-hydrolase [Erythrobacter sp.]
MTSRGRFERGSRLGWARALASLAFVCALAACTTTPEPDPLAAERAEIAERMRADITTLASDAFGGRKPGTPGEERTLAFLSQRMAETGLVSGTNDPGSAWRGAVPLVSTIPLESRITMRTNKGSITFDPDEAVAYTSSRRALVDGTGVVFVGEDAGEVPPEAMIGRIVVMRGRPVINSPRRDHVFQARPAAVVTVLENEAEIAEVEALLGRERIALQSEANDRFTAFVTREALAEALPAGAWDALVQRARGDDFMFEELEATIAIDARTERREFVSANLLGLLPGTMRGAGTVLVLAHWDHLGECAPGKPDPICNGAIDNASGIAAMLELARRLGASGPHDRDILFLATSAEEFGLLGAKAFVARPPMPLDSIVAAFNLDTAAVAPAGSAVGFVGEGRTALDEIVLRTLREQGRELGDRDFAETFVQRQDGWVLLDEGVPTVLLSTSFGSRLVLGPYLTEAYHKPGDEGRSLELGGAIDDILLHEALLTRIASTSAYPGAYPARD